MRGMALVLALLASCVSSSAVRCPDGSVCREGTECLAVPDGYACAGAESVCGNGRVEDEEVCDDGNARIGDGCSPDCLSNETCGNGTVDPVRLEGDDLVAAETCDDAALVGHDGCSSTCIAETLQILRVAQSPRERERTAMASDMVGRRIVMFGGLAGDINGFVTGPTNDTWELAGDGWTRVDSADAPSPRSGHAMAFDGARIILFGGAETDDETWALDGRTWTRLAIPATERPKSRWGHSMAYLPGTGIVMFGGALKATEVTDELWVFANDTWTQLSPPSGPGVRVEHSMVLDPVTNELLLVGGRNRRGEIVAETWSFDGTAWTRRDSSTTPSITAAVALYDERTDRIVLYGGAKEAIPIGLVSSDETWVWDRAQWTAGVVAPFPRHQHAGAVDPVTGDLVVFGGVLVTGGPCPLFGPCPPVFNMVLDYSKGWADRTLQTNDPSTYAIAHDPWRQRVVALAGSRTFERGLASWRLANETLPILSEPALGMGRIGDEHHVLLFGGQDGGTKLDHLRWWDGSTWSAPVTTTPRPEGRRRHQMVYDAKRDRTIVFGGLVGGSLDVDTNETWEWNGSAWRQIVSSTGPGERTGHAMAFDPISGNILMFGGGKDTLASSEMWSLDGDTWQQIDVTPMPSARRDATLAWDAARRVLVLAGGTPSSNVWEWNGTQWRYVNLDLEGRFAAAGCSSPTGAGILLVGGRIEGVPTRETLHVVATSPETYATCRSQLDDDGDGRSGCDDLDCWATCSPFCSPAETGCEQTGPRCGDGVCDAPRENCGICADCECVYCGDLRCDPPETAATCASDC